MNIISQLKPVCRQRDGDDWFRFSIPSNQQNRNKYRDTKTIMEQLACRWQWLAGRFLQDGMIVLLRVVLLDVQPCLSEVWTILSNKDASSFGSFFLTCPRVSSRRGRWSVIGEGRQKPIYITPPLWIFSDSGWLNDLILSPICLNMWGKLISA